MKTESLFTMLVLWCCFTYAFSIHTDFGAVEIPELQGYVRANESMLQNIQNERATAGAMGKTLFALLPENQVNRKEDYTTLLTFSRGKPTIYITDDDFETICNEGEAHLAMFLKRSAPSVTAGTFQKEKNIFFMTADISLDASNSSSTKLHTVSGQMRVRGRLFSFNYMTSEASLTAQDERIKQYLRSIRDANNGTTDTVQTMSQSQTKPNTSTAKANPSLINRDKVSELISEPKTRFRTLGIEKAAGVDIQIDYPKSMTVKPGHQPHIVQTFNKALGPCFFSIQIMVNPIPAEFAAPLSKAAHFIDKDEIEDFSESWAESSVDSQGLNLLDFGSEKMSGFNMYWYLASNKSERLGFVMEQMMKSFAIPAVKGKLLVINFMLGCIAPKDDVGETISTADFNMLNPLVMSVLNSLTFMNKKQVESDSRLQQGVHVGTAWFVSPTHIVTCWHVLENGSDYFATDFDGKKVSFALVAKDEFSDLAVLKVAKSHFSSSHWLGLTSLKPQVADKVYTVGFPHPDILGQEAKYTEGTITALSGPNGDKETYLQMTTPIQQGNSGGPLVNGCGQVVAVVAMYSTMLDEMADSRLQNVNFAVKADKLEALLKKAGVEAQITSNRAPLSSRELYNYVRNSVILLQVR